MILPVHVSDVKIIVNNVTEDCFFFSQEIIWMHHHQQGKDKEMRNHCLQGRSTLFVVSNHSHNYQMLSYLFKKKNDTYIVKKTLFY